MITGPRLVPLSSPHQSLSSPHQSLSSPHQSLSSPHQSLSSPGASTTPHQSNGSCSREAANYRELEVAHHEVVHPYPEGACTSDYGVVSIGDIGQINLRPLTAADMDELKQLHTQVILYVTNILI